MKSAYLALIVLVMMGLTVTTSQGGGSPWPMFRHDLRHTGRTPYTGPASPVVAWSYPTDQGIASSPTIGHDGTIYVGVGWKHLHYPDDSFADSCLLAINPDGSLKWCLPSWKGFFSSPTIGDEGVIYTTSLSGSLLAIEDLTTYGNVLWERNLEYFFALSSPALAADGMIYVGSPSFYFYAVNPDGSIAWKHQTFWCIISTPAIGDDGIVYIGSKDHHLYAFDPELQQMKWRTPTGTFYDGHLVDASPAIGPYGTIYVGTDQFGAQGLDPVDIDTSFWAFNPDGSLKWAFATGSGVESSPAIGLDGTIYFGSYDGYLYAVTDAGDQGILQWKFPTGDAVDGSPTVDGDGNIYFGSRDSTLYALYPDGTVKWTFQAGGGFESSPTIDGDGMLYIGCFDGHLYALGTGAPDVGVTEIIVPDSVDQGISYTPRTVIRNFRADAVSFDVVCTIEQHGEVVYADTITASGLRGGQSDERLFDPWAVEGLEGGMYAASVTTVLAGDDNTDNDFVSTTIVVATDPSGILGEEDGPSPRRFSLSQNYPNPFNPVTSIEFHLPEPSHVTLKVYDLLGAEIRRLIAGQFPAGPGTVVWDGLDGNHQPVASGIYFYRLEAGTSVETRKMVLLK
ncbi:PQQ-binding-like beta-propeller repeat protein [Candidatus Zixiibacteriota bacterium]